VQQGPDGEFAWVVEDDATVRMQKVVTAAQVEGGGVLVASGLGAGQRVVTEGQFRLKPGIRVTAMAPGEVAAPSTPPAAESRGRRGRE
jgi:multidrug efflux system membrane fusion protein